MYAHNNINNNHYHYIILYHTRPGARRAAPEGPTCLRAAAAPGRCSCGPPAAAKSRNT